MSDTQKKQKNKNGTKKKNTPKPPRKITPAYLHNAGLYYLQRFVSSSGNFKAVMRRKIIKSCRYHTDQDMEDCLRMLEDTTARFIETGYINDDLYTQGMVGSLRRAGKSARAITAKLQGKAIPEEAIESSLRAHEDSRVMQDMPAELEAAMTFARKKRLAAFTPALKITDDEAFHKLKQKQMAQMARAGFSYDTIKIVFETKAGD